MQVLQPGLEWVPHRGWAAPSWVAWMPGRPAAGRRGAAVWLAVVLPQQAQLAWPQPEATGPRAMEPQPAQAGWHLAGLGLRPPGRTPDCSGLLGSSGLRGSLHPHPAHQSQHDCQADSAENASLVGLAAQYRRQRRRAIQHFSAGEAPPKDQTGPAYQSAE